MSRFADAWNSANRRREESRRRWQDEARRAVATPPTTCAVEVLPRRSLRVASPIPDRVDEAVSVAGSRGDGR
jgi:hypothetical protein